MTYAGLTTADKGALLKAKECGGSTYSRWSTIGNEWVRELTVNIDLALAQIAEMESAKKLCPYCSTDAFSPRLVGIYGERGFSPFHGIMDCVVEVDENSTYKINSNDQCDENTKFR